MRKITGAVVGLGKIGFGFSSDSKRKGTTWTHAQAFERAGVTITGGVDPDASKRREFLGRYPAVPAFATLAELLRHSVPPDLVSICSPTISHGAAVKACVAAGVRSIFCEKPITSTVKEAREILTLCRRERVVLAVNHTRRWDSVYCLAQKLVASGRIGEVVCVNANYSGHIYNFGTHLVDTIRMIVGGDPVSASGFSPDPAAGDPHVSGLLEFKGGVPVVIACHGKREDLVFDIEVTGREGKLRVVENGRKIELLRFRPSPHYSGYRELLPRKVPPAPKTDRFVEGIKDILCAMRKPGRGVACSGTDGYYALAAAEALRDSARNFSRPVKIVSVPRQ